MREDVARSFVPLQQAQLDRWPVWVVAHHPRSPAAKYLMKPQHFGELVHWAEDGAARADSGHLVLPGAERRTLPGLWYNHSVLIRDELERVTTGYSRRPPGGSRPEHAAL